MLVEVYSDLQLNRGLAIPLEWRLGGDLAPLRAHDDQALGSDFVADPHHLAARLATAEHHEGILVLLAGERQHLGRQRHVADAVFALQHVAAGSIGPHAIGIALALDAGNARGDRKLSATHRASVVVVLLAEGNQALFELLANPGVGSVFGDAVHLVRILLEIEHLPRVPLRLVVAHQLVAIGAHAIHRRHHVHRLRLVVVVVDRVAERLVAGLLAHHRNETTPVRGRQRRRARKVEEGRTEVDVLRQLLHFAARLQMPGPAHDQWHAQAFLIHPALVIPTVVTEVEALVRAVDDEGVLLDLGSRIEPRQ